MGPWNESGAQDVSSVAAVQQKAEAAIQEQGFRCLDHKSAPVNDALILEKT